MANPFKKIIENAEQSKSKISSKGIKREQAVYTKTCSSCGAPRPLKTNLVSCSYCNHPFMDVTADIKSDA